MSIENKMKAKELYEHGKSLKEIASILEVNYNTLKYWKTQNFAIDPVKNNNKDDDILTEQETNFCIYFVHTLHVFSSATRAGYSESYARNNIYQLMKKPKIKKFIKELKTIKRKSHNITADDILETILDIVYNRDIGQCYDKETLELRAGVTNVKKFKVKKGEDNQEISIELEDRMKAVEILVKHYGIDPCYATKKAELRILEAEEVKQKEERERIIYIEEDEPQRVKIGVKGKRIKKGTVKMGTRG